VITSISTIAPSSLLTPTTGSVNDSQPNSTGSSFSSMLGQAFQQVSDLQNNAAGQAASFALGRSNDVHSTVIAAQKATIALELATQIRNKVLDAYQEVMKTSM
jgi:flagellar hook-basal body complex protein FliE